MNNQYQINTEKWSALMNSLKAPKHKLVKFNWGEYYHENIDCLSPELRNDYCYFSAWDKDNENGKYIVLFTEEYDNVCMSITNASEIIATAFLDYAGLRYEECLLFESYPYYDHEVALRDRQGKIYFDQVEYEVTENYLISGYTWEKTEILTNPKWHDRTEKFINLLQI